MTPTAELLSILGAVLAAVATIVGAVVSSAGKTRDRIEALRADVAGVDRRVARLEERVGAIPPQPVDEADCRERHDAQGQRLARLEASVGLVLLGLLGLLLASAPAWALLL